MNLGESGKFRSISAISPIVNPSRVPWGQKALTGYLEDSPAAWEQYDACSLVAAGKLHARKQQLILRLQDGYDHSYYFISNFIKDHIEFHAKHLQQS